MNRQLIFLIITLCSIFSVSAAKNTFTICYEFSHYPPFLEMKQSSSEGLLIDMVRNASISAGVQLELVSTSWVRCQNEVQKGRADALFAMIKTPEREKLFAFPKLASGAARQSLWTAKYPLFVNSSSHFNSETFQPKLGVGAPYGYVVWQILKQNNWLSQFQYTPEEGLRQTALKTIDGYVVEQQIGRNLIRINNLENDIKETELVLLETEWFVAFSRKTYQNRSELVEQFWRHIAIERQKLEDELANCSSSLSGTLEQCDPNEQNKD